MSDSVPGDPRTPLRDYTYEAATCVGSLAVLRRTAAESGKGPLDPTQAGPVLAALNSLDRTIKMLHDGGGATSDAERAAVAFVLRVVQEVRQQLRRLEDVCGWEPPAGMGDVEAEVQRQRDAQEQEFQRLCTSSCANRSQLGTWGRQAFAWVSRYQRWINYPLSIVEPNRVSPIAYKARELSIGLVPFEVSERLDPGERVSGFRIDQILERLHYLAEWCEAHSEGDQGGAADQADGNLIKLDGRTWHIKYGEARESGSFQNRPDSNLRHLARLLAEPNRRFDVQDFRPPPSGDTALPAYGRDASSDDEAITGYERELQRLAKEIKEADDAHDTETAGRLREKFDRLSAHHQNEVGARRRGHKRQCGTRSPAEKADHALRVGLERVKASLRQSGLPKLADHLDRYLDGKGGEWWYAPPPDTSSWEVIIPTPSPKN